MTYLITAQRVRRRVAKLNRRRQEQFPLWASAGEDVLCQVAGPVRTETDVRAELDAMRLDVERRLAQMRVTSSWQGYLLRERVRPYFTPVAMALFDRERCRIYPRTHTYASCYWRELLRELGLPDWFGETEPK